MAGQANNDLADDVAASLAGSKRVAGLVADKVYRKAEATAAEAQRRANEAATKTQRLANDRAAATRRAT